MDRNDCFKLKYTEDAFLVGKYGFPMLEKTNFVPDKVDVFRVSKDNISGTWCHFFTDDYRFTGLWTSFDKYFNQLSRYDGVITTDFSMYTDFPLAMQIWNCYRNRVMAYYMQKRGLNIIPCVSWSNVESFSWCFDGIAKESTIAVSTNGCMSITARQGYIAGMEALDRIVRPDKIIVVGKPIEVDVRAELIYYESEYQKMEKVSKNMGGRGGNSKAKPGQYVRTGIKRGPYKTGKNK